MQIRGVFSFYFQPCGFFTFYPFSAHSSFNDASTQFGTIGEVYSLDS